MAVAYAIEPELCPATKLRIEVDKDGFTREGKGSECIGLPGIGCGEVFPLCDAALDEGGGEDQTGGNLGKVTARMPALQKNDVIELKLSRFHGGRSGFFAGGSLDASGFPRRSRR